MPLLRLAHYAIRTMKLAETRGFYVDVLDLRDGERPPFGFPGHWLYIGDRDVVHLVGVDPGSKEGLADYLGEKNADSLIGTGSIDHVAFSATDLPGMLEKLKERNIPYRERTVPSLELHQVFLADPNSVTVELNYSTVSEALDVEDR